MTDAMTDRTSGHGPGRGFWVGLALGVPFLAYGIRGAVDGLPGVQLTSFLRWFVGSAVVHDLVLGPSVCLLGVLVVRLVPPTARAPVQAVLFAGGVTALVAWPFVRGYGVTSGEPSFLSRNYTASVLTIWAGCLVAGVAWTAVSARRRRIRSRTSEEG